jgi:hypothetical protein
VNGHGGTSHRWTLDFGFLQKSMVEKFFCAKVDGPAAGTVFCGSISLEVFQSPLTVLGSKRVCRQTFGH